MFINFYTLPYKQGICCERCGTYIRNVAEIHFDDGFVLRCGLDCLNKHVLKDTNLTEYGKKQLKKHLKTLEMYDKWRNDWGRWNTPEESEKDGGFQRIEFPENSGNWRIRTQAEFDEQKQFMLTDLIPYRIQHEQDEMKKKFRNTKYHGEVTKKLGE